jgi:ferredoxin
MTTKESVWVEVKSCCSSGYGIAQNTLRYYPARCINCGMCLNVCPHAVFGAGSDVVSLINPERCIECGACQLNCPAHAITVNSGVGCAAAMIRAALTGSQEVTCGCDGEGGTCC